MSQEDGDPKITRFTIPPFPTGTLSGGFGPPILRQRKTPVPRRVSYDEYLRIVATTFAWRHRSTWSWRKWRFVCRCGSDLPCRFRHRVPVNRGHWPREVR
jgi:hypothetical protein